MSCVLHIEGENFELESFLSLSKLAPYKKHHVGEIIHLKTNHPHQTNGCSFDLSNADFDNLVQQQKDAIAFLTKNFDALTDLEKFGIQESPKGRIDFGTTTRMTNPDIAVQTDEFEVELLRLAGSLGFSILFSQYHESEE